MKFYYFCFWKGSPKDKTNLVEGITSSKNKKSCIAAIKRLHPGAKKIRIISEKETVEEIKTDFGANRN